ncbi:CDP-glycerol glycerophosphotransferase family protein [Glutamicibacter mishrai]|uniref:Glycosyltransferase n=1 Tax=Glutamicibacter mishrai TaxID=1775880 RepID=A0A6H0SQR5_9MICC|nr:CDP-glycerol glycerophosphotransferase family protein [Glutamicibacter mishrai]QIV88317.1 glycosyltransferase [Glutamicibacter mishrai]
MMVIKDLFAEATIKHGQLLGKAGKWAEALDEFKKAAKIVGSVDGRVNYLVGNAYFQLKNLPESLLWTKKALSLVPDNYSWNIRLGALYEQTKRHTDAADAYEYAVALQPGNIDALTRLARAYSSSKRHADAREVLANAIHMGSADKSISTAYVSNSLKNSPTWQKIEALQYGLQLEPANASWLERLGAELASLNRYAESAEAHSKAIAAGSKSLANACGLVRSSRECGRADLEADGLELIRALKPGEDPMSVVAQYYQSKGHWPDAYRFYKDAARDSIDPASNLYNTGLAADRNNAWAEASEWFREALEEDPDKPARHYRMGLALERQERYKDAAQAYDAAIRFLGKDQPYWSFRLAFVLWSANDIEGALQEFLKSLPGQANLVEHVMTLESIELGAYDAELFEAHLLRLIERNDFKVLHDRGVKMLKAGHYEIALRYLTEACRRDPEQNGIWFFHKALAAHRLGLADLAISSFLQTRVFVRADGIAAEQYLKAKWRRDIMEYVSLQESTELDDQAVLYESYFGGKISCNPLALYRELAQRPGYATTRHYWVVTSETKVPEDVRQNPNVILVPRGSRLYLKLLASAGYLINNVTFPHYFVRREGQRYLNTWHGTPLKTLGKDIGTGFMEHANVSRNFLQATELLAPNDHTRNVLIDRYDISGLYSGRILRTGTPRIDQMLSATPSEKDALRTELGIPEGKKVIFYAPTWRGSLNTKHFDTESLIRDLGVMGDVDGTVLLFRAHHMTEAIIGKTELPAITVPENIASESVLAISDVLITDYSSIFFDFMPMKKPIIYHVPDLDEYKAERGLYFDFDELPGTVTQTPTELMDCIKSSLSQDVAADVSYSNAIASFSAQENGSSAKRTVDAFFGDDTTFIETLRADEKKVLLFHQSLLPNGITSAFINMLNAIDPSMYRVVFLFDPAPFSKEPLRMDKFAMLPEHVQKIARVGAHLVSLEERWVIDKFNAWNAWGSQEQEQIYQGGFAREFERIFGQAKFDAVIEFDGYAPFWSALLGSAARSKKKIAFMHNRIYAEWTTKYPELAGTMKINKWYDKLLSVSAATNDINRDELGHIFDIPASNFRPINNLINFELLYEETNKPLDSDIQAFLNGATETWLSIGRMSPEKAHLKLFKAFRRHLEVVPGAKLVLLGDGPLRVELEAYVSANNLGPSILLAGQRSNPFAVMRAVDAFVLASDHEGQPMVLLEALTLGLPVLATDIVGNRGILEPGYGLLVENSVEGLSHGFQVTLDSAKDFVKFDVVNYCDESLTSALSEFVGLDA